MIKKLLFTLIIAFTVSNLFSQGIFISEVVDGTGSGGYPKYVELTNSTTADVDLNGYKILKSANGNTFADAYVFTSAFMLPAGASMVVVNLDNTTAGQLWSDFNLTAPALAIYGATNINGNGDDAYAFADAAGTVLDSYGTETDGTGLAWEYTDSYAYRNASVTSPNATFTQSEWTTAAPNTLDGLSSDLSPYLTPGIHGAAVPVTVDANILTFSFVEQTNAAVIDTTAGTVVIEVLNGTALTALVPSITVSMGATISPDSGVAQDYTAPVSYVVTASDATTKNWTVTVSVAAPAPVVTIYDIQGQVDASPYDGMPVITNGIVTATSTSGYWIQDGTGAWNGIYVYDAVNVPAIGDDLTIEGEVAEYYGLTQVKNLVVFTVNSSSNTLPVAEELTTLACNEEAYEGVLVKTLNAEVINADAGYGMWTITNGTAADSVQTDDVIFHFEPNVIYNYNVTGVMYYSFNAYKLLPRDANDIETIVGVNQSEEAVFSVYPNPAVNEINLVNIKNIDYVTVSDVTGKQIAKINVTSESVKISTSDLEAGMYIVSAFYINGNISTVKFIKK